MSAWTKDILRKISGTDELQVSPLRDDRTTYRTPTTIWSVIVDDVLYVRAYNGPGSVWYQTAMRQKTGQVTGGGITKEVTFEPVGGAINERVDEAYRTKYKGSPYLAPMISTKARAATVKVMMRDESR